jgi:hypothetical protein
VVRNSKEEIPRKQDAITSGKEKGGLTILVWVNGSRGRFMVNKCWSLDKLHIRSYLVLKDFTIHPSHQTSEH